MKVKLPKMAITGFFWCVILGCGSENSAWVNGKVTLDGTPLDEANISFVPKSGSQDGAAWTEIEKGEFSVPATSGLGTGEFRVEIRALRNTGKGPTSDDPTIPVNSKEILPPRYNTRSELVAKIELGENSVNFDLKSK